MDLDIVNPYFRKFDLTKVFEENNVDLVAPMYANTNLDIPAISFNIEKLASEDGYLIIDVGGDDVGALALGRYHEPFTDLKEHIDMYYVINSYRYMTKTPQESLELLGQIETASRMKATAIINNSNLGYETDKDVVLNSIKYAQEIAKTAQLPIKFTSVDEKIKCDELDNINAFYQKIYVKPLWENI